MAILGLYTLALIGLTAAQTDDSVFYNPPTSGEIHDYSQDYVWAVGSTQQLRWSTEYETVELVLWQNNNPDSSTLQSFSSDTDSFDWLVDLGPFELSDGAVFFFQMYNGSTEEFFSSHYFNLTVASASSSSVSSSISSSLSHSATVVPTKSLASVTSAAASSGTSSVSASSTPSGGVAASSGLSTGAQAGVGIGVALAALIVVGAVLFVMRRRKVKRPRNKSDYLAEMPPISETSPGNSTYHSNQKAYSGSNEMAAPDHRAEMPVNERHELGGG